MRIDLKVPYAQKEEAKKLGARWDMARKTWYVIDPDDLSPFMKWMQDILDREHDIKVLKKNKWR